MLVVISVAEGSVLGCSWGAGEEGFDCWGGVGVRWSSNVLVGSKCAGFSRSMEIFSVRLFSLMVKYLALHLMIRYGQWLKGFLNSIMTKKDMCRC